MYCIPPTYLKILERNGEEEEDLEWTKMNAKKGLYRHSILGNQVSFTWSLIYNTWSLSFYYYI